MSRIVSNPEFIASYSSYEQMPKSDLPEIAVIGRSNVGKSSFINKITGAKNLARSSKTPGRTQAIVCFQVGLKIGREKERQVILVDLPGFGYAKLGKEERGRLSSLILDYLSMRRELNLVCLLNDCRRQPEEELEIRDLVYDADKHLLVIINKVDKLSANERRKSLPPIISAYGLQESDVILSGHGISGDEFWHRAIGLV